MAFKANILFHLERIQRALPRFAAEATMDVRDFTLEIRGRNRYYKLFPQFLSIRNGKINYSPVMPDNVRGFHGWTPYFNKQWLLATDKLEFKRYCTRVGLPVPEYSLVTADDMGGYLVKPRKSSFAYGIRGPFRNQGQPQQHLSENEYFDQFIEGDIIKAWFWDDRLTCLEVRRMPALVGDGISSLRQLIIKTIPNKTNSLDWSEVDVVASYQGFTLDSIIPDQHSVLVDYRYGSTFIPLSVENSNVLAQHANTPLTQQLAAAGPIFWQAIPEHMRQGTMHAVDAILDHNSKVWFLESNCNSMVHPDLYFTMLESLFGPPAEIPAEPVAAQSLPPAVPIPSKPRRVESALPQSDARSPGIETASSAPLRLRA